jgi:iron complex outermembrane receptor protein
MKQRVLSSVVCYRFLPHLLCIFLLITLHFALSTRSFAGEQPVLLEDIVVTATRYVEKQVAVPANITTISEKTIKNSTAQNIPDLLRLEAGIYVSDMGGNRRNISVDIRGFGETAGSNTLVLVDGRKVNQADLSGTDWLLIPLERVERIEIIRGGRGSVLYGDNATGGVINIITKEGDKLNSGVELSGGSFNTFKGSASVSGSVDTFSFSLSGNYLSSDGYRDNGDSDSRDFGVNADYYVMDSLKLGLSSGYHKDNAGLPGALRESDFASGISRTATKNPGNFAKVEDYYGKISPQIFSQGDSMFKMDTSFRKRDFLSFATFSGGNFTGSSKIRTVSLSPQVLLKSKDKQARNSLTFGLDYQKADNDIDNDSLFFGSHTVKSYNLDKQNLGYYLHHEINFNGSFSLSGGYRHDKVTFDFHPGTPERLGMDEEVYTAGINYPLSGKSYAYFSYSQGFRYPLLDELFSFFTNTVNTGLLAQTSDNYELGVRQYLTNSAFAHINIFRIDTDKEIFFNPATYANENQSGMSRREGAEVSINTGITSWLNLKCNYSYTMAEIKEGIFKGKNVPNVPMHKASAEATVNTGGVTVSLNGVYIGERPFVSDFSNTFGNQKSYIVLNSKARYQWKSLTAFLDINNLTDNEYSEYGVLGTFPAEKAYYPSPGRNILIGISAEI